MKKNGNRIAFQGGSYSLIMTAIVLAILIVVNICASALSTSLTKFDISSSKLYSITSNTKVVVNSLEKDVTIYWIVQSDEEDSVIENLLDKYDSLSSHISVVKKNPDVYPTFAKQYTDETVANNSLVVECGDRYRYIAYSDIYVTDVDVYSYSYTTSFDGEGAITSAIDYVVSDELPQIYCLEGHGESDLPSTFSEQIDKANIEVNTLSLLTVDQIPEDASCIVIYAPQSDISQEEKEMLADYVSQGGKLLVMAGPVEDSSLENLYDILADYNITANEGIVIEADRDHYAFQRPYILIPDMNSSDITDSLMDENYYPIMPISLGLTVGSSSAEVTELLVTSEDSFSKLDGYSLSTYDKEDGDIDGSFAVAVSVETDNEGQIIWFASSDFLDDMYNAYSSGANDDLAMNALSALIGEREALAIRSKSLNYNYLTISDAEGSVLKVWMIGILPLMYLGVGIFVTVYTRSKQNEAI
jgi:ABC-2 type transport system permease protein